MSNVSGIGITGEVLSASIIGSVSGGSVILNEYVISVSDIAGGHRITITNGIATQNIDVMNGVGDEMTSNKVTSISSASTDTQYPSAKCVYDIVGNVESVLDSIIGGVS